MGMFDTVYFDRKYPCPFCRSLIASTQTKAFENVLDNYHIKDCISPAEDIRIVKEELFCWKCSKHTESHVYLVVNRGILVDVVATLQDAKALLNDLNLEKLILWYHDLYRKYMAEKGESSSYDRFLNDLYEWFGEAMHRKTDGEEAKKKFFFFFNRVHLKGALSPVEAVRRFLTHKKMLRALDSIKEEGFETLEVYYPEQMEEGEVKWSVDVYQDEINERAHLNWTWTVISKEDLEQDKEKEDEQSEWVLVVDSKFSEDVVTQTVSKWLHDRGYDFKVKMIPMDEATGSGLLKELRTRKKIAEKEELIPAEEVFKHLDDTVKEDMVNFIESKSDRKRVFYYEGFYGSLVPEVESDRLVGKIENISEVIIYEGKTVSECEHKFKESVSAYVTGHKRRV